MTKIKQQRQYHEFSSLALIGRLGQNNRTTKLLSVKPSRHPLAIFSPNTATGEKYLSLQDTHNVSISYGGLIDPIKDLLAGNKSSRIVAVVNARFTLFGKAKLTKLLGNPRMNHLLFTLARLSPAQSFAIGVVMAFSIIGFICTAIVIVLAIAGGAL